MVCSVVRHIRKPFRESADRPKVLATVQGKPFLLYLLDRLAAAGIRKTVLLTSYLADQVLHAVGDEYRGMRLIHSVEPCPLGTGGALCNALDELSSPILLLVNGDSWCDVDLADFDLAAKFEMRAAFRNAASLVIVSGGNDEEAAGQLLAFGIGSIGNTDPAGSGAHHAPGVVGQLFAGLEAAFFAHPVRPAQIGLGHRRELCRRERRRRAGLPVKKKNEIGHGLLLCRAGCNDQTTREETGIDTTISFL